VLYIKYNFKKNLLVIHEENSKEITAMFT
jgi:hypothetical protein